MSHAAAAANGIDRFVYTAGMALASSLAVMLALRAGSPPTR
jgi:hypothetical protein